MSDERNRTYASAVLEVARAENAVDEVRSQLLQIGTLVAGSDELRTTLSDRAVPAARRQQVVEDLLGGKVSGPTLAITSMLIAAGRGRDIPGIADELGRLVAAGTGKQVAVVRSAIELTDDQRDRLAAALEQATGSSVEVRVVLDESVLGGIVAQVGDTVIDGTVRRRLDQLKQAI